MEGQGLSKPNLKDEVLGDTARSHSLAREFEKATKLTVREQDQIKETLSTLPPQLPNPRPKPPKFGQSSEAPWDKIPTSHRAVKIPPEKKASLREQVNDRKLNTHSLATEFKKVRGEMVQSNRTNEEQGRIREALSTLPKQWNPLNGPGPLGKMAETFRGATYTESVTTEPIILYRVHGGEAGELSSYWTRNPQKGSLQSKLESGLLPQLGNTADKIAKIEVPPGTTIYEGVAAAQGDFDNFDDQKKIIRGGQSSRTGGGKQVV